MAMGLLSLGTYLDIKLGDPPSPDLIMESPKAHSLNLAKHKAPTI